MRNWISCALGILLSVVVAVAAVLLRSIIPSNLIGASALALLIGILVRVIFPKIEQLRVGTKIVSGQVLKLAIILMGAKFCLQDVWNISGDSLLVIALSIALTFGLGLLLGRVFKIENKLVSLVSTGTAICGASAISAVSPVIDADSNDIAYAICIVFLMDIIRMLLYPLLGAWLSMSNAAFGLFSGVAVNDTASVVAIGYAFSEVAGDYAVIVKLTRTLFIIPVVLIYSFISLRGRKVEQQTKKKTSLLRLFPWFTIIFLAMVILRSVGVIGQQLGSTCSTISKYAMTMALGAVGLNTNIKGFKRIGLNPLFFGITLSILMAFISFVLVNIL